MDYNTTNGITLYTTSRMTYGYGASTSNVDYEAKFELPVIGQKGITIDVNADNTQLIISGDDETVEITGVPAESTSGTLTEAQLSILQLNKRARIKFNSEYFYLNDDENVAGTLVYAHTGYNQGGFDKYFTITISTRGWVISTVKIVEPPIINEKLNYVVPTSAWGSSTDYTDFPYAINIHGHTHNSNDKYNMCAENINYTPVPIKRFIEDGISKKVVNIHRETIDKATERKRKRK